MHRRLLMNILWPRYRFWLALAIFAAFYAAVLAVVFELWWLFALAVVTLFVFGWFYAIVRWVGRNLHKTRDTAQTIWRLVDVPADTPIIYISTGIRETAAALYQQHPNHDLTVVDVYNPQLMRSKLLGNLRQESVKHTRPHRDQRIDWLAGRIDLLPVPNNNAPLVIVDQVLSELDDHHNRTLLLEEVHRVLESGGQLILVEKVQTPKNNWTFGLAGLQGWETLTFWRSLLTAHNHEVSEWEQVNELLYVIKTTKSTQARPRQMQFTFPERVRRRR